MLEGINEREINEHEAVLKVTGADTVVRMQNYADDIKIALLRINGIKTYREDMNYRNFSREQFLKGEIEQFIDWVKTDAQRKKEMEHLPPPHEGYQYHYNNKHEAEYIPEQPAKSSTSVLHVRKRRTLKTLKYGFSFYYGASTER